MRSKKFSAAAAATIAALALSACGNDDANESESGAADGGSGVQTVKVGFSGALSGAYAAYDAPLLKGMQFAEEEINEQGGIDGIKVEVVSKDNKGEQTQTAATTQELLDDGVGVFVLTTGDTSVPSGLLAVQSGAIASVGGNTAPSIVQDVGERAFMLVYGDNAQAAAGAEYSCEQGYESAYLIGSDEIPYTKFIPEYYETAFAEACGGEIVGTDQYKIGATEFATQVAKIKAADPQPDVIYTSMFIPDFGAFMKQLRASGVDTPVVTVDGNDSELLIDSAGKAVDGVVFTTSAFPQEGNPVEKFISDFETATGEAVESNTLEAIGRDNVYAIVEAAAEAGSTEPDAILDAIYSFTDQELITGNVTMDREAQVPEKDVWLVEMQGTEFTYLDRFVPENTPAP